jgi:hypothetical protein
VQPPPLEEKDFIHEEYSKNPWPFWGWLAVVISISLLFSGASFLYFSVLSNQYEENPFLQVTNRQISLFLWQNPQHMRVHVKNKSSYLPAFQYAEKIGLDPAYADDFVIAPPELLFLYHTWQRLLGDTYFPRKIPENEFRTFLVAAPEWDPRFWKQAPKGYVKMINDITTDENPDLNLLNLSILPLEVRQAFVGWKNYYFEGDQINSLQPTYKQISEFLKANPHYGRNYWCNIVGHDYLKSLGNEGSSEDLKASEGLVPISELSSFLRVAFFNDINLG